MPKLVIKHNAINNIKKKNLRIIDENLSQNVSLNNSFTNNVNWINEDNLSEHPYQNELQNFIIPTEQLIAPDSIKVYF